MAVDKYGPVAVSMDATVPFMNYHFGFWDLNFYYFLAFYKILEIYKIPPSEHTMVHVVPTLRMQIMVCLL